MESFYDVGTSDLKDIWDSDIDPSDALKLSSDPDMHDWFLERDIKMPQVILHDKLISDALVGNLPIKTEHSYSINSDGYSMSDSPRSLQTKMEEIDDDCYPVISINTFTKRLVNTSSTSINQYTTQSNLSLTSTNTDRVRHHSNIKFNKTISEELLLNGKISSNNNSSKHSSTITVLLADSNSTSGSDIDIDDSCIKEEPMSPESSFPPSPTSHSCGMSLNTTNMATFANTNAIIEHKNSTLKLSSTSDQSLFKSQQISLDESRQNVSTTEHIIPKCNIKIEPQSSVFGLPPTPPSSLPSDESEGNQSPEHHTTSPISSPSMSAHCSSAKIALSSPTSASTRKNTSVYNNTSASSHYIGNSSTGHSGYNGTSTRQPIHTPLISSQPKGSTGTLVLTDEEKRTLIVEGYPIPTRLPLTKAEEKSLKKIRRKIKNKISAQESRRKKKEYMDHLERKVEILVLENSNYKKKVESLEDSNANLLSQLARLQALLDIQNIKKM